MDGEIVTVIVSAAAVAGAAVGAFSKGFLKSKGNGKVSGDTKVSEGVVIDMAVIKAQYEGITERLERGTAHFDELHEDVKDTKNEVRELRRECKQQLDDHEGRIRVLERGR